MMKHFLLPWLPAVLLCAACSPESSIDRLCRRLFPEGEPGAAVLVLKGDHVLFDKGYGLADLQTRAPIDGNTSFNIASVSKQFTAVAVLQLAGQRARLSWSKKYGRRSWKSEGPGRKSRD